MGLLVVISHDSLNPTSVSEILCITDQPEMGRIMPEKDILYFLWFLDCSFTTVQDDLSTALPPALGMCSSLVPVSSWPRKLIQLKTKWCQPSQLPDLII